MAITKCLYLKSVFSTSLQPFKSNQISTCYRSVYTLKFTTTTTAYIKDSKCVL